MSQMCAQQSIDVGWYCSPYVTAVLDTVAMHIPFIQVISLAVDDSLRDTCLSVTPRHVL